MHFKRGSPVRCCVESLRPLEEVNRHLDLLKKDRVVFLKGGGGRGATGRSHLAECLLRTCCQDEQVVTVDCSREELDGVMVEGPESGYLLENADGETVANLASKLCGKFVVAVLNDDEDLNMSNVIDLDPGYSSHLLTLLLRRRALDSECSRGAANDQMLSAVSWLGRTFRRLLQSGGQSPEHLIKTLSEGCPVSGSTHDFRTWFVDTWNGEIARTFSSSQQVNQ